MKNELVIVIDFGGQYNQLVARRVRECNVYCEIYSYKIDIEKIKEMNPKGIILTGGPNSCYEPDSPTYTRELFELGIPVLGLCYGAQLMSHVLGGEVKAASVREYGKTEVLIDKPESKVFENVSESTICWMSHFDYIAQVAPGFEISAHTADCPVAAAENAEKGLYAIQFHPEVLHTAEGTKMINNFVKNVILDNILPGDIYLKARELRFSSDVSRVCMLIKITTKTDISAYDIVQNLFPDKNKDFVININETDIALVKEIRTGIDSKDLEKLAGSIVDTLSSEFYTHCVVGIGTTVTGIKDLARSFKEAQVALEVGKVFDTERSIVSYDNLGIARLIYQLPTTLCEMFLKEVFKRGSIESLDAETLFTIQRFFENNLNVSETSRKLFVHRNTLVYRLEKIKKLTGLDLREFEDAIVFKVALMVKKYLSANPVKY